MTRANLIKADIWAKVIWGDIGRPDLLAKDLIEDYGIALEDLLNVRTFLDHNRKILLAKLMKEHQINSNTGKMDSVNAQEREARADQRYSDHIKALSLAVQNEAELSFEITIVRINFETWKTKMINQMKEAKDYGVKK